jgi:hypothetical protein
MKPFIKHTKYYYLYPRIQNPHPGIEKKQS